MTSPQSAGGLARAEALTPQERRKIARKAAQARWNRPVDTRPKVMARAYRLMDELLATLKLIEQMMKGE